MEECNGTLLRASQEILSSYYSSGLLLVTVNLIFECHSI